MKKFLSLVLALIMTMSLVTISAGATEYRDLTDKDEIQYEEAVAVLNRIGVITGYEDGSFRPETELTRGAAAKIIVSLLIGPDAAANLPNATAPYPDVPASHTFAGVISYCKTAGIISGYGDGTFKPSNSLTGFAFAKMLLGALGYKSEIEGFVDTGWTMNVARVGNVTGLFDRLDFDGAASVNREQACQLALNTLKATMVTYGGTTMVTGAQTLAVQGTQAMYVTSNNREINANINRRVISAANNEMTLEFGEEHFKDLRLEHDKYDPAYDDFGHPSNEWSYKKVTIGTFRLPADFTYEKQISHLEDTAATKEKALGLRGYDTFSTDHRANYTNWSSAAGGQYAYNNSPFDDATQITINGWDVRLDSNGQYYDWDASSANGKTKAASNAPTLSEIADLTDNGVTVEVYVCPVDADFITNVVVTRTQMMKVKRIGSDYVTLETETPDSRDPRKAKDLKQITGYNAFAIDFDVVDVKDSNYDAYNSLKDLKAGDRVAVVPFTPDQGKTWEVGEAYVPETVSGTFTKVDTYANVNKPAGSAVAITVGGTSYPINEWNKDMLDVTGNKIKATKKDVTLYLAKDGTVLWADEIGNSDAWMVVGDYYQANSTNGKVGWYVHGWTIGGEEVDLDLGTIRGDAERYAPGELVYYDIATGGNGEYTLTKPNYNKQSLYNNSTAAIPYTRTEPEKTTTKDNRTVRTGEGVYDVAQFTIDREENGTKTYEIKSRNGALALQDYNRSDLALSIYNTGNTTQGGTPGVAEKVYNKTNGTVNGVPGGTMEKKEINYVNVPYDGVKFIFVNFDGTNGEVETIDFKSGVQNVDYEDLIRYNNIWRNVGTNVDAFVVSSAEAYVNKDGNVKAVVIKSDSSEADLSRIAVITDTPGDKNNNTGAEGDRPTGLSYAKQYVTGPNFNISDEKTGWFDKDYPIGTILVISEKDNLIVGKYFHSNFYSNGNPDAMLVNGIGKVLRADGGTNKGGFLVGGVNGTVHTLNGLYELKETMAPGTTVVTGNDKTVQILTNKYTVGYDTTNTNTNGLITVDSNTTFIDLRAINNDTIDSLSDLLDHDLATVRLRVLLNGAVSTDTFRHAYVVVVERATEPADNAKAPNVVVNAMNTGVAVPAGDITVTEATSTAHKTYTIVAPAGDKLTLGASVTGSGYGTLSAFTWKNVLGQTIAAPVVVEVPATGEAKFTVSVTNTDNDKKDLKVATTVVDIIVKAKESDDPSTPTGEGSIKDYTAGSWDNSKLGVTVNTTKSGTVNASHQYTVVFNVDRTKAVKDGKVIPTATAVPTKITYEVYAGDAVVRASSADTVVTLGNLAAGTPQSGNALLDSSAQLTVKVTSVEWSEVNVYYEYTGKYAEQAKAAGLKDGYTASVKAGVYKTIPAATGELAIASNKITFVLNVDPTTTVQGAVNGGTYGTTTTGFGTATEAASVAANGTTAAAIATADSTTIAGTDPVVVTINTNSLTVYDQTFTVAGMGETDLRNDFDTLAASVYKVTVNPTTQTVAKTSGKADVTVAWDAIPFAKKAYEITLVVVDDAGNEVSAVSAPIALLNNNTAGVKNVQLTGVTANGTVTVKSVTELAGPEVTGVAGVPVGSNWAAGDKIVLRFAGALDTATAGTSSIYAGDNNKLGTTAVTAATVNGSEVELTLAAPKTDNGVNGTITIAAGAIASANGVRNSAAITITFAATSVRI